MTGTRRSSRASITLSPEPARWAWPPVCFLAPRHTVFGPLRHLAPRARSHGMTPEEENPGLIVRALTHLLASSALPDPPPADPMPLLRSWFEDARDAKRYDDFDAMALATATPDGAPSVRMLLCKRIEVDPPALVFYTSYASRKGRELTSNPRAAAVFHWPHAGRQARVEGVVRVTEPAESDEY